MDKKHKNTLMAEKIKALGLTSDTFFLQNKFSKKRPKKKSMLGGARSQRKTISMRNSVFRKTGKISLSQIPKRKQYARKSRKSSLRNSNANSFRIHKMDLGIHKLKNK